MGCLQGRRKPSTLTSDRRTPVIRQTYSPGNGKSILGLMPIGLDPVIREIDVLRTTPSETPGSVEIMAALSDDTQVMLFRYYADELSFT